MAAQSFPTKSNPLRLGSAERRLILIAGDLAASIIALFGALFLWSNRDAWLTFSSQFLAERVPFWFWFMPLVWMLLINDLYDLRKSVRLGDTVRGILISALVGLMLYLVVFFVSTPDSLPRQGVAFFIGLTTLLTLGWRLIYIRIFNTARFLQRIFVVGAGKAGSTLCKIVAGMKPPPFFIMGLIDDDAEKIGATVCNYPVLGNSAQLEQLVVEQGVTGLVVAITGEMCPETFKALVYAQEKGLEIRSMPAVYEELLGRVPIFLLQSDWLLRSFTDQTQVNGLYEAIKRLIDILGGLVGSVVLALLAPVVSLAIILETGSPIIFTQKRVGKNGQDYWIFKFRTMIQADSKAKARVTTSNDDRITRIGRFLRKSHLDEMPQFLNVLKGEMSVVGPRAEQVELVTQLQAEIPFYRARLLVKPGITGWAQVNFGYAATVEDTAIKLEYDLYYIKHRNLLLDILIMLRTFGTIVGFRGQ